jgi:hypothetical protein
MVILPVTVYLRWISKYNRKSLCFFLLKEMMLHINKVMQYVENNESTKKLKLYINKDHENNELLST